jgi:hypothetical protein
MTKKIFHSLHRIPDVSPALHLSSPSPVILLAPGCPPCARLPRGEVPLLRPPLPVPTAQQRGTISDGGCWEADPCRRLTGEQWRHEGRRRQPPRDPGGVASSHVPRAASSPSPHVSHPRGSRPWTPLSCNSSRLSSTPLSNLPHRGNGNDSGTDASEINFLLVEVGSEA